MAGTLDPKESVTDNLRVEEAELLFTIGGIYRGDSLPERLGFPGKDCETLNEATHSGILIVLGSKGEV
jgi:hypothetical protein